MVKLAMSPRIFTILASLSLALGTPLAAQEPPIPLPSQQSAAAPAPAPAKAEKSEPGVFGKTANGAKSAGKATKNATVNGFNAYAYGVGTVTEGAAVGMRKTANGTKKGFNAIGTGFKSLSTGFGLWGKKKDKQAQPEQVDPY